MKKYLFIIISVITILSSCDMYPDWKKYVTYSDVYPICGEYLVKDYDITVDTVTEDWYSLYIYNKSYNPTKDSIWIDNSTGHPTGATSYPFKFKIKCKADTVNLTFDVTKAGSVVSFNVNPLDSAITISIKESKIIDYNPGDIEDPTPDSINFIFTYFDKYGNQVGERRVAGHRKNGWEFPNFEDDMQ